VFHHDPTDPIALALMRWMANALENAAVQTYFTREGERPMSASLICGLLDQGRVGLAKLRGLTDEEWGKQLEKDPDVILAQLETASGGCPDGWENDGGACIPCYIARLPWEYFGWSEPPPPVLPKAPAFTSNPTDPNALTQFRWLTNELENAAIQTYLARKGKRVISAAAIRDVFFKTHDRVTHSVATEDAEVAKRYGASVKADGWGRDSYGYLRPTYAPVALTRFGMPPPWPPAHDQNS